MRMFNWFVTEKGISILILVVTVIFTYVLIEIKRRLFRYLFKKKNYE